MQMLGLEPQLYKRCDQLSGGQKQRVGIGRALIQNPALLLCDEPIASLDPNAARVIMDTLAGINRTLGITVLVNLHQVDVALRYAGRIIGVNQGRVVYDGPPAGVTRDHIATIYGAEADELLIERQVTDVAA